MFSRTVCGLDHTEALRFPEEDVASTTQIPCLLPRAVRLLTDRHKSLLAAPSFCSIVSLSVPKQAKRNGAITSSVKLANCIDPPRGGAAGT